jgi:hypothetical protein
MKHILPMPPAEVLRSRFEYNPETGVLTHKSGRYAGQPAGHQAGVNGKYLRVKIGQTHYRVHRIIWVLWHGQNIPEGAVIDHIDRNPRNNRIDNLRLATVSFNLLNSDRFDITRENMKNQKKNSRNKNTTRSFRVTIRYPDGTSVSANSLEKAGQILGVGAATIQRGSERGQFRFLRLEGVTIEIRETRAKSRTSFKKKQTKRTRVL